MSPRVQDKFFRFDLNAELLTRPIGQFLFRDKLGSRYFISPSQFR